MSSNIDLARRFHDAVVSGDIDAVRDCVSDDFVLHEPPSLPYGGDYHGHEESARLGAVLSEVWEGTDNVEVTLLDAGDDRVLSLVEGDVVARATGTPVSLRIAEIHTIRDGKIVDARVFYWDTAEVVKAMNG